MPSRPELRAPPEFFYNEEEARKYTTSSCIIEIQGKLTERALELLALPDDGVPRLLLDIGCGSGLSGETLSEKEHHGIGLDISKSMLDVSLERKVDGQVDLLRGQKADKLDVTLHPEELEVLDNVMATKYEEAREGEKLRNQREDFHEMVAEAKNKRKRKMQEKEGNSKKKDFKF